MISPQGEQVRNQIKHVIGDAQGHARDSSRHQATPVRGDDPGWAQYNLDRRMTMRFDTTSGLVEDPRSAERALWEGRR